MTSMPIATQESHQRAMIGVQELTLESQITANIINMFRNVFPSIRNYIQDVALEFKSYDETDFKFSKASKGFSEAEASVKSLNFIKIGQKLIQVPEGFKGEYVGYLNFLNSSAVDFINNTSEVLGAYYTSLNRVISSKEAKLSQQDNSKIYADMEKRLQKEKDALADFFDSKTSNALRTVEMVFSRAGDISETIDKAKILNKSRELLKTKDIMSLTSQIADLINLLVEQSEGENFPEISGPAAKSIAQGALVAAHYVEFVGVLRYRIEEAINAVGIMSNQIVEISKEAK